MTDRIFMKADEVAEVLEVSKAYAYKLMRQMNKELKEKGYLVIAGKVDRKYFYENFYGSRTIERKEEADASLQR